MYLYFNWLCTLLDPLAKIYKLKKCDLNCNRDGVKSWKYLRHKNIDLFFFFGSSLGLVQAPRLPFLEKSKKSGVVSNKEEKSASKLAGQVASQEQGEDDEDDDDDDTTSEDEDSDGSDEEEKFQKEMASQKTNGPTLK